MSRFRLLDAVSGRRDGRATEGAVESGPPDADARGDLRHGEHRVGQKTARGVELVRGQVRPAPTQTPAGARSSEARARALAQQVAFHLGEHGTDLQHGAAHHRGGVDPVLE